MTNLNSTQKIRILILIFTILASLGVLFTSLAGRANRQTAATQYAVTAYTHQIITASEELSRLARALAMGNISVQTMMEQALPANARAHNASFQLLGHTHGMDGQIHQDMVNSFWQLRLLEDSIAAAIQNNDPGLAIGIVFSPAYAAAQAELEYNVSILATAISANITSSRANVFNVAAIAVMVLFAATATIAFVSAGKE